MLSSCLPPVTTVASSAAPVVVPLLFSCSPAIGAPLRFVLETLFLVKSLFAFIKNEFRIAILAR